MGQQLGAVPMDGLSRVIPEVMGSTQVISKKEPACTFTYYALLCLTGTRKAFVRKFCKVHKPGQVLTVDLQPTYLKTYVPCRKV